MNINGQSTINAQLPAALAAHGGLKVEGVASGVAQPVSATLTPAYTDNVTVVTAQVVAKAAVARTTIDLSTKKGAEVFVRLGRGGTTAIASVGIDVLFRKMINGTTIVHPAAQLSYKSSITASNVNTTIGADAAAGATSFTVASGSNIAADQILCLQDSGGGVTRLEWVRVSKVSGTTVTIDAPLQFAHTAVQADTVRNQGDAFNSGWLPGGASYEVILDYGQQSTGDSITVQILAQTYNNDTMA